MPDEIGQLMKEQEAYLDKHIECYCVFGLVFQFREGNLDYLINYIERNLEENQLGWINTDVKIFSKEIKDLH